MSELDSKIKALLDETESEYQQLIELKNADDTKWLTKTVFEMPDRSIFKIKVSNKDKLVEFTTHIIQLREKRSQVMDVLSMSNEDREFYNSIQNHTYDDWMSDIKKRWRILDIKDREKHLKSKIEKIKDILSPEQIREMKFKELLEM